MIQNENHDEYSDVDDANENNNNNSGSLFGLKEKLQKGFSSIASSSVGSSSSPSLEPRKTKKRTIHKESPPLLSTNNSEDENEDDNDVLQDIDINDGSSNNGGFKLNNNNTCSLSSGEDEGEASPPLLQCNGGESISLQQQQKQITLSKQSSPIMYGKINNDFKKKLEKLENNDQQEEDDMLSIDKMVGYAYCTNGEVLYWISIIFTAGIAFLIYYWFNIFYLNLRYKKVSFSSSNLVLVHSCDKRIETYATKSFEPRKLNEIYSKSKLIQLVDQGLDYQEHAQQHLFYGDNEINFPIKSIPLLLLEEVLHPFFIFQLYSVFLWMAEEYYYYAIAIFLIATISATLNLVEIRSNLLSLKKISYFSCMVDVLRDGQVQELESKDLVPGDIIQLRQNFTMPCDVILLTGQAILNESMLTGESIPVTKYSILSDADIQAYRNVSVDGFRDDTKDFTREKRSLLYGGTMIMKLTGGTGSGTDKKVYGMVRHTSFQTTKGKLILSILYPKKSHFKFFAESLKFVGVLCSIALVGFSISVWRLNSLGEDPKTIVLRALDLITIVIPPALPMAMTVGTGFAMVRLKKSKIFCISPPRINMAGKIQVFCFDKTGTLTEEGLDLYGILPTIYQQQQDTQAGSEVAFTQVCKDITQFDNYLFKMLMASCHSLSVIDDKVSGDPLEVKIFEATHSVIHEDHASHYISIPHADPMRPNENITYLEKFDFQSQFQRMSVLVQFQSNKQSYSFVKGSPEMLKKLSLSDSIPSDYDKQLAIFTEKGYRVLSCAYKPWDGPITADKDELRLKTESQLIFLGFIVMENKIKSQSPPTIDILQKANIKTIMCTGDNPLTAKSVAKQTGIIKKDSILFMGILDTCENADDGSVITWEHISKEKGDYHRLDPSTLTLDSDCSNDFNLIITGPVFKKLYHNYLATGSQKFNNMLKRGIVYSRMTPDEKQVLVEELQRVGLYVAMCGDGANDCGALKAAHIGISLSESEASIAAPFTSTVTDISCCPTLIKEGRASLAVSFKLFQFMGMYSLIQFTTVIFLYFIASVLGNWMYLYQDLWIIFPLVIFMGMTRPCDTLSIKRPSGRLISGAIVGSLVVHVLVCISFQTVIFFFLRTKSWYNDDIIDDENIINYVTTTLFTYGCFQYLIIAFTLSFGKPFLKPLYTNRYLFLTYLITLITSLLILFLPTQKVWDFGQLLVLPVSWRLTLFGFICANLVLSTIVEFSFYMYKKRSKKKKVQNVSLIYSKEVPIDPRITENSVLLPIS
ncbi:hypothetical protein CYY_007622 [Polysphondylium violaceum]|uniref:Cation-transporting ATPase n=1 Tax=Polysphondylium violaceum TaxID=133409 RepID=A0A8J4UXX3_9MYCE|nr:hypothetical protein CYY_007622 [Polysphondylium violaceum]